MQSLVGKPDRQITLLERIAKALETAGRDAKGNPLPRGAGGALGAAGQAVMRAFPGGAVGNPLAALFGKAENLDPAKLLGGMVGGGQDKGNQLLQNVKDLMQKNVDVLNKIDAALTDRGIKVAELPEMAVGLQ